VTRNKAKGEKEIEARKATLNESKRTKQPERGENEKKSQDEPEMFYV